MDAAAEIRRNPVSKNQIQPEYGEMGRLTRDGRAGRPGSSEVPRNPLTRWDMSSIPANGIFLTKKTKKQK